jgi:hypothetical protein
MLVAVLLSFIPLNYEYPPSASNNEIPLKSYVWKSMQNSPFQSPYFDISLHPHLHYKQWITTHTSATLLLNI